MQQRNVLAAALATAMVAGSVAFAQAAHQAGGPQAGGGPTGGKETARAHATIAGNGISGTAEFVEMEYDTGKEVEITVTAKGLRPGLHGMHIHAVDKCEAPA